MSHKKFKIFQGSIDNGKLSKPLMAELKKFSAQDKVDPKSIGIEYLESKNEVIVSLGYAEKKSKVSVDFKLKQIGNLSDGLNVLELKAEKAATKLEDSIICHELFIDGSNNFHMIFMVGKTAVAPK